MQIKRLQVCLLSARPSGEPLSQGSLPPHLRQDPNGDAARSRHAVCLARGMPNKNRSKDSKPSAEKNTLNPPGRGKKPTAGAMSLKNPSGLVTDADTDDKIGQFTGRGSPGLRKK
jgi:hypothetical protein